MKKEELRREYNEIVKVNEEEIEKTNVISQCFKLSNFF